LQSVTDFLVLVIFLRNIFRVMRDAPDRYRSL